MGRCEERVDEEEESKQKMEDEDGEGRRKGVMKIERKEERKR